MSLDTNSLEQMLVKNSAEEERNKVMRDLMNAEPSTDVKQ